MTTTSPGTDKTEQALPPLPHIGPVHTDGSGRIVRWPDQYKTELLEWWKKGARAALTHRQQGVVGQAEVRTFEEWLNDRRDAHVAEVFHDIVARYSAALTAAPPAPDPANIVGVEPNGLSLGLPSLCSPEVLLGAAPPAQPQSEPTRSQRMAEAGFTRRDTRLECDECGAKVSAQLLPIHRCAAQPPERAAQQEPNVRANRPARGPQETR